MIPAEKIKIKVSFNETASKRDHQASASSYQRAFYFDLFLEGSNSSDQPKDFLIHFNANIVYQNNINEEEANTKQQDIQTWLQELSKEVLEYDIIMDKDEDSLEPNERVKSHYNTNQKDYDASENPEIKVSQTLSLPFKALRVTLSARKKAATPTPQPRNGIVIKINEEKLKEYFLKGLYNNKRNQNQEDLEEELSAADKEAAIFETMAKEQQLLLRVDFDLTDAPKKREKKDTPNNIIDKSSFKPTIIWKPSNIIHQATFKEFPGLRIKPFAIDFKDLNLSPNQKLNADNFTLEELKTNLENYLKNEDFFKKIATKTTFPKPPSYTITEPNTPFREGTLVELKIDRNPKTGLFGFQLQSPDETNYDSYCILKVSADKNQDSKYLEELKTLLDQIANPAKCNLEEFKEQSWKEKDEENLKKLQQEVTEIQKELEEAKKKLKTKLMMNLTKSTKR
ncbi:hypothetical protein ['Camptotheca acuminata' phytoplasma]|uniref:hypothetical protein n=1 Tax='Camptotheca acuminata' phytoplasma TaxID=3239192 RepID=UPI00351A6174